MGVAGGPNIERDGLVFALNPGSTRSYSRTGTDVASLVGNREGSLVNGTAFSPDNGGVFSFDGTNDRVSLDSAITLTNEWTILYWFYHDSSNYDMTIGEYNTSGNRFYHRDDGANYKLRVHNNSAVNIKDMTLGDIRFQWAHLGYSKSSNNDTVLGWVNGEEALNSSNTDDATFVVDSIGYPYTSTSFFWTGKLASILIYNRQLSTEEYLQIFNAQKGRFGL